MGHSTRSFFFATVLLGGMACASQGQSSLPPARSSPAPAAAAPAPTSAPASAADSTWLKSDSSGRTVSLTLVVTQPSGGASAQINGHRSGDARIVVPLRWTVKWDWRNDDPATAHSLVVMTQREKLPLEGGRSAFSNAMTRSVTAGLASGQTDQSTFEAEEAGFYWLMCGVPGHALNGEWLELQVSPEAGNARIQLKQR